MKKPQTTPEQDAQRRRFVPAHPAASSVDPPLPSELLGREGTIHDGWQPIRARDEDCRMS